MSVCGAICELICLQCRCYLSAVEGEAAAPETSSSDRLPVTLLLPRPVNATFRAVVMRVCPTDTRLPLTDAQCLIGANHVLTLSGARLVAAQRSKGQMQTFPFQSVRLWTSPPSRCPVFTNQLWAKGVTKAHFSVGGPNKSPRLDVFPWFCVCVPLK